MVNDMNAAHTESDFIVENGVLIRYVGTDYDIVIPEYVTAIAENAIRFYCFKPIISLTIPKSVTYIHPKFQINLSAFKLIKVDKKNQFYCDEGNCLIETKTKTLMVGTDTSIIPDGGVVTTIGHHAFCNCTFKKIIIPNGVTSIGYGAFFGCENLEEIILPETLISVGWLAFCDCKKLKTIILPKRISNIEEGAFCGWVGTIRTNNEIYYFKDQCLIDARNKTLIACCGGSKIPSDGSVKRLGFRSYFGNRYLQDVKLPDAITLIGRNAFEQCKNLKSIVLSDNVTIVGGFAFKYCENLEKVVFGENLSEIGENAFHGIINDSGRIKLKEVLFKNPNGWSVFYLNQNKEIVSEVIPKHVFSNPMTAARFIIKQTRDFYRRVVFKKI